MSHPQYFAFLSFKCTQAQLVDESDRQQETKPRNEEVFSVLLRYKSQKLTSKCIIPKMRQLLLVATIVLMVLSQGTDSTPAKADAATVQAPVTNSFSDSWRFPYEPFPGSRPEPYPRPPVEPEPSPRPPVIDNEGGTDVELTPSLLNTLNTLSGGTMRMETAPSAPGPSDVKANAPAATSSLTWGSSYRGRWVRKLRCQVSWWPYWKICCWYVWWWLPY